MNFSVYIHSEVRQHFELTVLIYTVVICWNLTTSSWGKMDRYLIFQYVRTYMRCALNFGDTCTLRELVVSQRQSETVNGINYIFIFTWRGNALVHRWTQVLQNGKQFVLHYLYTLSYFCLMKMCKIMREERKGLWLQQTQCICDL